MIESHRILLEHLVTEKAASASSHHNQYSFRVAPTATRTMVAEAVRRTFNVEVEGVRIINVKPKARRDRRRRGLLVYGSALKKALVKVKAGQTINLV